MTTSKRTVLITGCSDGSLGAALAKAIHANDSYHVIATARFTAKMSDLKSAGITTLEIDVLSTDSVSAAVDRVSSLTNGSLDMLINSAGGGHYQPFLHLNLNSARALFDVNVWGYLAVTQAFLPLLLKNASPAPGSKKGVIVNQTSISSVLRTPYHSAYSASKAAMAMFNDIQRLELAPLGIKVVDLKTGSTTSNFQENKSNPYELPADSPYMPIKEQVMEVISGRKTEAYAEDQEEWARNVASELLVEPEKLPAQVWRGGMAGTIKWTSGLDGALPAALTDGKFQELGGLDELEKIMAEKK